MKSLKDKVLEILGEMMTYPPFDKIEMPANRLNEIADKIVEAFNLTQIII